VKAPAVYILASKRRGTLYIGVTSNLVQRIWQHREALVEGFTQRYGIKTLVWFEQHATMESAIGRERAMKKWLRLWKLELVERSNPDWRDLWSDIAGLTPTLVVPAEAGTHSQSGAVDSRVRGNDGPVERARHSIRSPR